MTSLRQRMTDDMRIRNFALTTQRSYIHYVAAFAKFFNRSPADHDLDAIRQYQLHLSQERKLSPQSINCFASAVQFLYLVTLEVPWKKEDFPRPRLDHQLPIVLAADEVQQFLHHVTGSKHRAILLTCYGSGLRISEAVALQFSASTASACSSRRSRQGRQRPLHHALPLPPGNSPCLLSHSPSRRSMALPLLAPSPPFLRRCRANRLP
jgi:site-specific recombinase XerD